MKQDILILHQDKSIKDYVEAHIKSEYNLRLLFRQELRGAFVELASNKEISLIIAEYELEDKLSSELFALIKTQSIEIPMILLVKKYPTTDKKLDKFLFHTKGNCFLKIPLKGDELVENIKSILDLKRPSDTEGYRRVQPNQIDLLLKYKFDFYILDPEKKYVKVDTKDGDEETKKYLRTAVSGDDDYIYIKKVDFNKYITLINQAYSKKMLAPGIKASTRLALQFNSVENLHHSLIDLGMGENEIQLANANIKTSHQILEKSKKVSNILTKFMNNNNYIYQLAMLTSYLSSAILMQTDWFSYPTMQKLSLAALLQDIALDNEELAKIASKEDLEPFDSSIKKKIHEHPSKAISMIGDVKEVCIDTRNLILNHHERPDNTGFPKDLTSKNISPLNSIYILAHEFSHRLIAKPLTTEILEKAIKDFEVYYSVDNFKKPYLSFKKAFKKKR